MNRVTHVGSCKKSGTNGDKWQALPGGWAGERLGAAS